MFRLAEIKKWQLFAGRGQILPVVGGSLTLQLQKIRLPNLEISLKVALSG